eukprot:Polyplicarium_translucidae@DN1330_c0_g1_i1.p2
MHDDDVDVRIGLLEKQLGPQEEEPSQSEARLAVLCVLKIAEFIMWVAALVCPSWHVGGGTLPGGMKLVIDYSLWRSSSSSDCVPLWSNAPGVGDRWRSPTGGLLKDQPFMQFCEWCVKETDGRDIPSLQAFICS